MYSISSKTHHSVQNLLDLLSWSNASANCGLKMTAKHSYVPFYKIIRTEQQSGNSFFYNKPFNRENSTVKNTMS